MLGTAQANNADHARSPYFVEHDEGPAPRGLAMSAGASTITLVGFPCETRRSPARQDYGALRAPK